MCSMSDKPKSSGLAVVLVIIGLVAFISFTSWAVIGTYLEVQTSKRLSRERMEKVARQIQEREAGEAAH